MLCMVATMSRAVFCRSRRHESQRKKIMAPNPQSRLKGARPTLEKPWNVHVSLLQKDGARWVKVRVKSEKQTNLHLEAELLLQGTSAHMRLTTMVLAGSLAERLCSEYGDRLNPDEVAKLAGEAYADCLRSADLLN